MGHPGQLSPGRPALLTSPVERCRGRRPHHARGSRARLHYVEREDPGTGTRNRAAVLPGAEPPHALSQVRLACQQALPHQFLARTPDRTLLNDHQKTLQQALDKHPLTLVSRRIVLRSAHDQGLPVRVGGAPPLRGPSEIELITALYADPQVRRFLDRHGVPVVQLSGPIWERFPTPHSLTVSLVTDLYEGCGLSLRHIELLTGRPAAAAAALLSAGGVQLRPAGGRSPFMRRWREGRT